MDGCRWRAPAYLLVVSTFFAQGWVVWTDAGSTAHEAPLSARAVEGQTIFRAHNCQACHQLFGTGGYLGPDLTNAVNRVPPARFAEFLDVGAGAMPAFHLTADERDAVWTWLTELDRAGQGAPTAPPGEPGALYAAALTRWAEGGPEVPAAAAAGAKVAEARGCGGCHVSFAAGGVGGAPDLADVVVRLGEPEVRRVLEGGRGGMPNLHLAADEVDALVDLLRWVGDERDALRPAQDLAPLDTPWFAYRDDQ